MNINFNEKVVVITGGSTGIGKQMALSFAKAKANVVINYFNSKEEAEKTVEQINDWGQKGIAVKADVTKKEEVKLLFDTALKEFGKVDILINNAGGMIERTPIEDLAEETWDKVYQLNVKSVFLCTQEALPYLKNNGGGVIINTASIAARNGGGPGSVHYASAKGAVLTMTKGLAKELLPYNIRVNGINPGVISTPFQEKYTPASVRAGFQKAIPVGREGRPDEIAACALFLASDYASYIYGENIEVNGGQWMD